MIVLPPLLPLQAPSTLLPSSHPASIPRGKRREKKGRRLISKHNKMPGAGRKGLKGAGPQHTTPRPTAEKWCVMEKKVWGFSRGFVYNDRVTIPLSHKSRLGLRKMAQK